MDKIDMIFNVPLKDKAVFDDTKEHFYDIDCYDGYAWADVADSEIYDTPETLCIKYPKLEDVLKNTSLAQSILKKRGLKDIKDIKYSDIMLCYGKIVGTY